MVLVASIIQASDAEGEKRSTDVFHFTAVERHECYGISQSIGSVGLIQPVCREGYALRDILEVGLTHQELVKSAITNIENSWMWTHALPSWSPVQEG
ncbi:hypothetical protein MTO96_027198 [Rhipicephalus appendiculatus]